MGRSGNLHYLRAITEQQENKDDGWEITLTDTAEGSSVFMSGIFSPPNSLPPGPCLVLPSSLTSSDQRSYTIVIRQ